MGKRKSKTTAEFKPPKRTQPRAKRQKGTEETNQLEDENQTLTPESENDNSHNALCSDKLDEHQPGQSTLQVAQTTEFPVDPYCSLEEKTSYDDNGELGNPPEVSLEIEQTPAITLQTPELDKSDKHTLSRPLKTEAVTVDQPNIELDDEESEITRNSKRQSQKLPDDCDSELPPDEHQTEKELSHETSCDQIQMPEDTGSADPLVKRKIRKRMGMCRLGERKKMLKGNRGNLFEGSQENETGQVTNEKPVMMSDGLEKDISISVEEEGAAESEVSVPFFSTSCPMENIPVQEDLEQSDVQYRNEVQILVKCMSGEPVTHETDNAVSSHADADDLNPLKQYDIECMEQNATESNIREDSSEVTTEIGTEVPVDFAEVQCSPYECDMDVSIRDHTGEQCVELMDFTADKTISATPVIHETENKCESSDFTLVAATVRAENNSMLSLSAAPPGGDNEDLQVTTVTAENKTDCENNRVSSLSFPAAPPGGDNEDVQSFTERVSSESDAQEPHQSPAAEPDPSSPLSMHSVTDSQLNNIPLSLEDLPISEASCDLEDASELVCGLIRDIASLNQLLMDARRKIGFGQQGRKPPLHTQKHMHNKNRF